MTTVTSAEAQIMLPRLLAGVAHGENVIITEDGLAVAWLVRPSVQPPSPTTAPDQKQLAPVDADDDDDRPWRGVFAIESQGEPYLEGKLQLSAAPVVPNHESIDIIWDRVTSSDE